MLVNYRGQDLKLAEIQQDMELNPDISEAVIKEVTARCVWAAGWMLLSGQIQDMISIDCLGYENSDEPGYIPAKDSGETSTLFGFQVTWTTEDDGMCAPIYRHQIGGEFEVWL